MSVLYLLIFITMGDTAIAYIAGKEMARGVLFTENINGESHE